ncbi:hypothetical protein J1614_007855 [Plenodomus biglobosus]|nr:hypothetical protein J1614_007855 [Plenodomus biglobosus]
MITSQDEQRPLGNIPHHNNEVRSTDTFDWTYHFMDPVPRRLFNVSDDKPERTVKKWFTCSDAKLHGKQLQYTVTRCYVSTKRRETLGRAYFSQRSTPKIPAPGEALEETTQLYIPKTRPRMCTGHRGSGSSSETKGKLPMPTLPWCFEQHTDNAF